MQSNNYNTNNSQVNAWNSINDTEPWEDIPTITVAARHLIPQNSGETQNIYALFTILIDNLHANTQIQLVNFDNPIVTLHPKEIFPSDTLVFKQFCHDLKFVNGKHIDYVFKIKSEKKDFYNQKTNIFKWLKQETIYMFLTNLTTTKKCYNGWMKYSNVGYSNKTELVKELKFRMRTTIPFQLV